MEPWNGVLSGHFKTTAAEGRGGSLLLEMTKQAHLIMNSAVEMVRDQPLAWKWKCFLYASDSGGYKRKLVSGIIQRRERARKPFGETSSNVWEWRQLLPWHGDHAALLGEHTRRKRSEGRWEGGMAADSFKKGRGWGSNNERRLSLAESRGRLNSRRRREKRGKKSRARE